MIDTPRPTTRLQHTFLALIIALAALFAASGCCGACGEMAEQIKAKAEGGKTDGGGSDKKKTAKKKPKKSKAPKEAPEEEEEDEPKFGKDGTRVIAKYRARLGPSDHSDDQAGPTETAARIIRQDRVAFHKQEFFDKEDETDPIFSTTTEQENLENMALELLSIPGNAEIRRTIIKFQPKVRVIVKEDREGERTLRITILERGPPAN